MTSDSILKTTTFWSYRIISVVCLAVFSVWCQTLLPRLYTFNRTQQPLFESFLVLDCLIRDLAGVVALVALRRVWIRVVLCEDARAIVNGEDQDRLDAEEREWT